MENLGKECKSCLKGIFLPCFNSCNRQSFYLHSADFGTKLSELLNLALNKFLSLVFKFGRCLAESVHPQMQSWIQHWPKNFVVVSFVDMPLLLFCSPSSCCCCRSCLIFCVNVAVDDYERSGMFWARSVTCCCCLCRSCVNVSSCCCCLLVIIVVAVCDDERNLWNVLSLVNVLLRFVQLRLQSAEKEWYPKNVFTLSRPWTVVLIFFVVLLDTISVTVFVFVKEE